MRSLRCDYLVVGGGAAGAVMAARLSDDPQSRVVLIEAGADVLHPAPPADVADLFPLATFNPAYTWPDLRVHWRTAGTSPAVPFQQGRVMGGGSTVMGMWALRGVPEDYDGWAEAGARGWAWEDVLPVFNRIEADADFDGPLHGRDGPIPIRRQKREDWSPLARAAQAALRERGVADIADMNGDFRDGHCVLPISRTAQMRASAGLSYLTDAVRGRANLAILPLTTAERLTIEAGRVGGVRARDADGPLAIEAGHTVVTAGAIYTPALLMRSGIGPGETLRAAGVPVLLDSPGIGANLQNHPLFLAFAWLTRAGRDARRGRPPASTYWRWSSGLPGTNRGDMGMYIRSYLVWHALGRRMAMIGPVLMRPRATGRVAIESPDPARPPRVEFNVLGHPQDEERMVDGFARACALLGSPRLAGVAAHPFLIEDTARLGQFNTLSRRNGLIAAAGAVLLDGLPGLGRRAIEIFARTTPLAPAAANENRVLDLLRTGTTGTNHVCGTARMGRAEDRLAVVDERGALRGLDRLTIADASVMPSVPSGNTHLPVVMVAERIADALLAGRRRHG